MQQEEILSQFTSVSAELLEIISSTGDERLQAAPATGGWSLAQIAEHLLKTYASVNVMNGNVKPTERAPDEKVQGIKQLFLDYGIKMSAPVEVLPSPGPIDRTSLVKGLEKRISQMKEVLTNKDLSLTCVDFQIPGYGEFTRLEWMCFNTFHTQRHIRQMNQILVP
ncbi:DinB family protein [Pedobacter immunditicola]|uniref:DinB family protein n=1 Tax=Pedobacter immunditicola TaxID=3133440 RepID=UPI0030A0D5C3